MSQFIHNLKILIKKIKEDDISAMASQLAYSLILSGFPFLIVVFSLIGKTSEEPYSTMIQYIKKAIPESAFIIVESVLKEVINTKTTTGFVSFGILFSIWSASAGFNAVIKCLNKSYDEEEHRGFIKLKAITVLCTLALATIIICSVFTLVFGEMIGVRIKNAFSLTEGFLIIWNLLRFIFMAFSLIIVFILVYRFTPCRKLKLKECIPGAIFTSFSWLVACIVFSFYVNNFSNYSKVYGSLGGFIVLIIWLFIISTILLIGGEINATWALVNKNKTQKIK